MSLGRLFNEDLQFKLDSTLEPSAEKHFSHLTDTHVSHFSVSGLRDGSVRANVSTVISYQSPIWDLKTQEKRLLFSHLLSAPRSLCQLSSPLISTQELISGFVCTGNQFYCNTGASRTAASGSGFGSQLFRYTILNV